MAGQIRYQPNGDNSILKLALYDAYRAKCYSCGKPQEFGPVQIDHIVPASTEPGNIANWVPAHRVQGYDLDAVYNLAPICKVCNGKKSNRDLSRYLVSAIALDRAWRLQAEVIRRAKFFQGPTTIAKFLTTIAVMDFENPDIRTMFEEHMPGLVRRLAAINPAKAHDFDELRTVWVGDPTYGNEEPVSVTLSFAARKSVTILEYVCGVLLDDALQLPMKELRAEIERRGISAVESFEFRDRIEWPSIDTLDGDIEINIDKIDVERNGNYFSFTFSGVFDTYLSGGVSVYSADGGDLELLQGDVFANGRFAVIASWELGDSECLEAFVNSIDDWQASADVW